MPDTTDRHLTIRDAETAIVTAMFFHARQAESYGEYGEGTPEDHEAEEFHRHSVSQLRRALACVLIAGSSVAAGRESRETEAMAWRKASEAITGV